MNYVLPVLMAFTAGVWTGMKLCQWAVRQYNRQKEGDAILEMFANLRAGRPR